MLSFPYIPIPEDLIISKKTEEMVLYEPFLLSSPKTSTEFPESDEPYYTALEFQLRHLIFKFQHGWISSERQVIHTSDECISTVHFIFNEMRGVKEINVFQRSSNLHNLEDDVQFFNYFIKKYLTHENSIELIKVNIFVSMPHLFVGKNTKF